MPVNEKEMLEQIDLPRERGLPFVMAWVYEKDQTRLYTGDLGSVCRYLRDKPTCHGYITYWKKGIKTNGYWETFGQCSSYPYKGQDVLCFKIVSRQYVQHMQSRRSPINMIYHKIELKPRTKYVLVGEKGGKIVVSRQFRDLPKHYMGLFETK